MNSPYVEEIMSLSTLENGVMSSVWVFGCWSPEHPPAAASSRPLPFLNVPHGIVLRVLVLTFYHAKASNHFCLNVRTVTCIYP